MGEFRKSGVAIEKLKTIVVATKKVSRNDVETRQKRFGGAAVDSVFADDSVFGDW